MSIQELIESYRNIVVQIATAEGSGTGFFLPEHQLIVTNYHVIKDNWIAAVKGKSLEKQTGTVVYTHPRWDLAFILLENEVDMNACGVLSVQFDLKDGDTVVAIGHPYGLDYTATQGVVSRVDRMRDGLNYIQTDTAINPGNSGGPLINLQGQVVGVNTFIIENAESLGFALPVQYIRDALAQYMPHYGEQMVCCSSCSTLVDRENADIEKYCPECGTEVKLPAKEADDDVYYEGNIVETIENGLESMGCSKKLARNGANAWSIDMGDANINIIYQPQRNAVFFDASMGQLPKQNIKSLYEYLLRENYKLQQHFFFTVQENVYFGSIIVNMDITAEAFVDFLNEHGNYADEYFNTLCDDFGCPPPVYTDR